mmetsp:Transcript_125975/g.350977  ORF Transcript_125975/g.350977 Transcript_125975/m.350977 type:complete len:254 (-) Transcript_125975:420-1181(-)
MLSDPPYPPLRGCGGIFELLARIVHLPLKQEWLGHSGNAAFETRAAVVQCARATPGAPDSGVGRALGSAGGAGGPRAAAHSAHPWRRAAAGRRAQRQSSDGERRHRSGRERRVRHRADCAVGGQRRRDEEDGPALRCPQGGGHLQPVRELRPRQPDGVARGGVARGHQGHHLAGLRVGIGGIAIPSSLADGSRRGVTTLGRGACRGQGLARVLAPLDRARFLQPQGHVSCHPDAAADSRVMAKCFAHGGAARR